jgi:hypothetical protein
MKTLESEARFYKSKALATSTKASYRTHLFTYLRFCIFYECSPVPASNHTLRCYVAHLARSMAPQSIKIDLNVIRIMHEELGLENPLKGNYEIGMITCGVFREKGAPPNKKRLLQ